MSRSNKNAMLRIIQEIAREEQIGVRLFSRDWIIQLTKDNTERYIFGYDFELNSSTAKMIAKDKSATACLLKEHGIPCIEHKLFLKPRPSDSDGTWDGILQYASQYDFNVICKLNTGYGGNDVFRVNNKAELELAVQRLFTVSYALCISPYYDIRNEYRIILIKDEPLLVFSKIRPFVLGDGKSTLLELIANKYEQILPQLFQENNGQVLRRSTQVLPEGEKIELAWKHNLGQGASPEIVTDGQLKKLLFSMAVAAAKSINIKFAAVDIVQIENHFYVLEINSGVTMEIFSRCGPEAYETAKSIYKKAIHEMFNT